VPLKPHPELAEFKGSDAFPCQGSDYVRTELPA